MLGTTCRSVRGRHAPARLVRAVVLALIALLAFTAARADGAISIGNVTVAEDAPVATFTVSLTGALSTDVSVTFDTPGAGTATLGVDYDAATGAVLIPAGELAATFDVPLNGDAVFEGNETFGVTLSDAVGDVFAGGGVTLTAIGTITDLVDRPTISIGTGTPSVAEGDLGIYTVTRTGQTNLGATVTLSTANGTATAGSDYTATTTIVQIPAGLASRTATVTIATIDEAAGATVFEGNETFTVSLSLPGNSILAPAPGRSVTTTITDDADTPVLTIVNATVAEGAIATLNVTRTGATTQPASVAFATADGTATVARGDYLAASGAVTLPAGTAPVTVPIQVTTLNDTVNEPVQRLTVGLSAPVDISLAQAQGVVNIAANDPTTLAINDVAVTEGDVGTVAATFSVTLSVPSEGVIGFNRTTADGLPAGNAVAPDDYVPLGLAPAPIRFAALDVAPKPITVSLQGDTLSEIDETFRVLLSGVTQVATGPVTTDLLGIGTIIDNDPPPILSMREVIIPEGNAGTSVATVTVTLSPASGRTVTASYATGLSSAGADATAGVDYVATSGTLTYAPGETTKTVPVTINGDTTAEGSETVGLILSNLQGAALPAPPGDVGLIIIADDDQFPVSPFANDDSLTVLRDTVGTLNVLANDVDSNGDFIFVQSSTQGAHGAVSCTRAGLCTYTPAPGFVGPDTFTYTVSDGTTAAPDVATVSVTVTRINSAPTAGADRASTVRGVAITVQVLANDTDADRDQLRVTEATKPADGTVICTPSGACRYTPNARFTRGTNTFTYTISDGIGSSTGSVTIDVRPRRPLVASAVAQSRRSRVGTRNAYTVKIANPNPVGVVVRSLNVCLPAGFTASGRPTGAITALPRRAGCGRGRIRLTWTNRLTIPAAGQRTVKVPVTVGGPPGVARVSVTATPTVGFAAFNPRTAAPITVVGT